ncbi:MAG TPA: D-arabinono-1,4-lactone oxidase [Oryzihumus sp.]|nr:D-arabinono-1,4-lactone oxidase [Oryzihumus sp.]
MTAWTNWAGTERAQPRRTVAVGSTDDVVAAVRAGVAEGLKVKPLGAGHSFTGAAVTDGVHLDLTGLSGLVAVDQGSGVVTVRGGTRLHELNPALLRHGLALPNLGDIDQQSITGAIATGTHGTGARLGGLATQVVALRIVLADGTVADCSAQERPRLFEAARVGLGALGVVTEVTLQCVPSFLLHAQERPEPLDQVLEALDHEAESNDHFEFFWFPRTDRVLAKRNNRVPEGTPLRPLPRWRARLDDELLANTVFEWTNRLATARPSLVPRLNAIASRALSARDFTDTAYRVFVTPRRVVFRESEYAVPREALRPVLAALRDWTELHDEPLPFPVEVRFAAADDIWLSTGYDRDNAYVAVHQYHRLPHEPFFAAFEAIVAAHAGRPHWGKLHSLGAERLRELYPRFDEFVAVRNEVDPGRTFGNAYLERVLGS